MKTFVTPLWFSDETLTACVLPWLLVLLLHGLLHRHPSLSTAPRCSAILSARHQQITCRGHSMGADSPLMYHHNNATLAAFRRDVSVSVSLCFLGSATDDWLPMLFSISQQVFHAFDYDTKQSL